MNLPFYSEPLTDRLIQFKPVRHTVDDIYKQLFYQHFQNLCNYAFTIVKDTIEVKDIVQTAYVKLWEKRLEVNFTDSAKSYLYTSVHRLSLNALRNRETKRAHHIKILNVHINHPPNFLETKEVQIRIQATIDQLPERCKEVFCKSRFEGKKYVEISKEMEISVKTVEVQMGKALKFLREHLSDLAIWFIFYFLIQ